MRSRGPALLIAALALIVAACGGRANETVVAFPTTAPPELPGEAFSLGPSAGAVLSVVGVSHDGALNVRDIPRGEVVAKLGALADHVVASGRARLLPGQIWYEVSVDDKTGWASSEFLAYVGQTLDETTKSAWALEGKRASVDVRTLGELVARSFAIGAGSEGGPSKIRISRAPNPSAPQTITYDVIGVGDDSIRGYRIRIRTKPNASTGGLALERVDVTYLCSRGVSSDGLCS